ncbi:unnamed protein product, partial [Rotaria sp. Silwood1]
MGFFIRHLHRHIEQLHREQQQSMATTVPFKVYRGQGKYDEALEHYQRALTVVAGESSEKDALFHNNIGTVLRDKGKYDEALKSYERALNIQLVCLSSLHPSLATT